MTRDAIVDNYLLKLTRDLVPIVLIVLVVIVSFEAYFIKHNADVTQALQTQNAILQQSQAQQGRAFEIFLKSFNAENNFECRVLWYLNNHDVNIIAPPSISVCQVTAP